MAKGFFNNVKNADMLSGLVEDIRDAMMDYQVCASNKLFPLRLILFPDVVATSHVRQELLNHRASRSISFPP